MLEAPHPDNDAERVAALRSLGILDTPPEQRFNRVTRTAARVFGVPIALITLVDDTRQWFKSRHGLMVPETPRSVSFCGHAILADEVFVVEDARADPRFADNPLVTGAPFVRFYAGRPLTTPGGVKLGTLCLIGREPRTLSDTDRLTLEDLAGWAEREINLSIEHSRIRAQLVSVLDRIAEGALLFGTDGRIQWANEQLSALLGHTAPDLAGKEIDSVVARESLGPVRKAIESLRPETEKGTTTLKAQMRHKDGRTLPLQLALVVSVVDGERLVTAVISRP